MIEGPVIKHGALAKEVGSPNPKVDKISLNLPKTILVGKLFKRFSGFGFSCYLFIFQNKYSETYENEIIRGEISSSRQFYDFQYFY